MADCIVRKKELAPTHENIYQTLISNAFGRNESVWMLAKNCYEIEHGAISLDAPWGEGKTFLIKQTQLLFDAYNPFSASLTNEEKEKIVSKFCLPEMKNLLDNSPTLTVYYDAWLHDGDFDPALSLAYEVALATKSEVLLEEDPNIKSILERIAVAFQKKDISELAPSESRLNPLEELKKTRKREETMREFFHEILPERGDRLVVFVDELDRCSPSFAVRLLERVKHFFDMDKLVFVFSINTSELQHAVTKFYGNQFNATKYLNRFFSLTSTLPKIDRNRFLEWQFGTAKTWFEVSWYCFCEHYNLSLRDILRMQMNMSTLENNLSEGNDNAYSDGISFAKNIIVPITFGLKMTNYESYNDFISGKMVEPLILVSLDQRLNAFVSGMKRVNCTDEDMIREIYAVIFGEGEKQKCEYNSFVFTKAMKELVLRLTSQLSVSIV